MVSPIRKDNIMNIKYIILIIALVLAGGISLVLLNTAEENENTNAQETTTQQETVTEENCVSDSCLQVDSLEYPVGELPSEVVQSLNKAIDDEYKARATYDAVIKEFGSVRPFSMIIRAEEQHISSLKSLFDKYGLTVPEDPYSDVEIEDTLSANCSVGVQAEIDNAALYSDTLLPTAADYPDITTVFSQLMNASQDKHLPAFERCTS